MLGIIFICVCIAVGRIWTEAAEPLFAPVYRRIVNPAWIRLVSWIFLGFLSVTWLVYLTAWLFQGERHPLAYGNGIVLPVLALAAGILEWRRRGKKQPRVWITDGRQFRKESVFFLLTAVFIGWWMWYVFHSAEGILYTGYTVFSDFSPHTAMIRSFS